MWFWLISNIAGSILGSAADSWFADTKCGKWFYRTVDNVFTWSAKKLNIKILKDEEKWRKKYPHVAGELDNLKERIKKLENKGKWNNGGP
tara:strand:+ start:223 stop:492 length:270 start_codon:yes stop_codon:yes gene_type:complete